MKQIINIHIGYHKTGTTSFQKKLSKNHNGINYFDRYDQLILRLVESVVLNKKNMIDQNTAELKALIVSRGNKYNLISNENFLRPCNESYKGLNYFLSILQDEFDIRIFISIRDKKHLLLSRFKHDLGKITKWEAIKNYIPFFLIKKNTQIGND